MFDEIGIVILAAGKGTRLKLDMAKPLAPILGECLIDFPLRETQHFLKKNKLKGKTGVVIGYQGEDVKNYLHKKQYQGISFAEQKEQKGTADALKSYFEDCSFSKKMPYTLILCADTPVLKEKEFTELYKKLKENNLDGVCATFDEGDPAGYGRIKRYDIGFEIIEEKETTSEQKLITEVNSGLYLLKTQFILDHLYNLDNKNKSGEFYLTDLFQKDFIVEPLIFKNKESFIGVNTLEQLEIAQKDLIKLKALELRENGVRFIDSSRTYLENDISVEMGSVIYPDTYLKNGTRINRNCIIGPGCIVQNAQLQEGVELKAYSHVEDSVIQSSAVIGPYARLRPGSNIGKGSKIGNFVETKKASLGENVGISHLSYVGDAEIGDNTNIGCGFITCNYDGGEKHKTIIGKNCFIGSDTQVIAPLEIGDSAYVASGSTINNSVPEKAFAIARGKQMTKIDMAKRFLKGKWKID